MSFGQKQVLLQSTDLPGVRVLGTGPAEASACAGGTAERGGCCHVAAPSCTCPGASSLSRHPFLLWRLSWFVFILSVHLFHFLNVHHCWRGNHEGIELPSYPLLGAEHPMGPQVRSGSMKVSRKE